jgi:hypothetical protein
MENETKKVQRSAIGCTIYAGQEAKTEILDKKEPR